MSKKIKMENWLSERRPEAAEHQMSSTDVSTERVYVAHIHQTMLQLKKIPHENASHVSRAENRFWQRVIASSGGFGIKPAGTSPDVGAKPIPG